MTERRRCRLRGLAGVLGLLLLAAHAASHGKPARGVEAVYTVQGDGPAQVRALTRAAQCPSIGWDGGKPLPMVRRAEPATVPRRGGGEQKAGKDAVFDVLVCETPWRDGAQRATVAGRQVPAPRAQVRRIVVVGDTGCRMKGSEKAFQSCNDPQRWPLAQVAASAAALKPDLVLHVGDIHYRESPCDAGRAQCANSPWGYGLDAWRADFFAPLKPLLGAAPWVLARGNHETCARAGQGWFRFIDARPWREERSCNDPALDGDANYSEPYAVALSEDTQLIVFDSSATSGKPFVATDAPYDHYSRQLQAVAALANQKPNNVFVSHHPLLAIAYVKEGKKPKAGGNAGLQSVFAAQYPERLLPEGITMAMHGHIHLFEAISFASGHPVSLVMGNSGSVNEGVVPDSLPSGLSLYPGAVADDYMGRSAFGFAVLERPGTAVGADWTLTEYTPEGKPVIRCAITQGRSRCAGQAR